MRKPRKNILFLFWTVLAVLIAILFSLYIGFHSGNKKVPASNPATNTPSFPILQAEIRRIDSLYEEGEVLSMERDFRQLLSREGQWDEQLAAAEYAWVADWMGEFHLRLGDLEEARRYNEMAFSRLDAIEDLDFKTHVLNNRAIIESDLGNFDYAIELLFKSMDMYETDTINNNFIDFYNNIGNIYSASKNYDLAIQYFGKLIVLAERLGLEEEYGYYHGNLGNTYFSMGELEKSVIHLQEAKAYFMKYEQFNEQLLLNTLLGANYVALGRIDEAETLLQGNLEEAETKRLWELYVETSISLFDLYVAKGYQAAAFEVIEQGLGKIDITNTSRLKLKIYQKLIDYYREVGDYENAFAYMQRHVHVQDSVFDASKTDMMREFTVKYEADRKNDQIAQLEMLHKKEKRMNTLYLIGLMILASIVALIILLLRRIAVQKKELQHANQTKDKLFSIIAHDLRSPMIALQGMGNLMQYYIDKKDERRLLDLGSKTGQTLGRVNHLLDNLLNWAVTNSNQMAYNPSGKEVSGLLEEAVSLHKAGVDAKEMGLDTTVEDARVFVDPNMISCVLRNIISNAVKYGPKGSQIRIAGICESAFYKISIADMGCGIPQIVVDNLHRFDEALVSGGGKESFGLGLRLALFFVKKNKGKLEIKNNAAGALIEIYLPLADR